MASIVAKDFKKLWPEHSQIIDKNLQALRVTFLEVVRDQQTFVLDNDIDTVVLLSPTLEDFASGNQLFVDETIYEPELEWSDEQKRSIQEKFTDDDSLWLLTDKKPSTTLTSMVPKARILVVDPLTRWGSQGIDSDFPFERWTISALDNTSK
ncbi:ABC-type metal ion transport system periplasmic component/surface adhesin [Vibrio maritimus]|uniref:ABC-type metal ion transport system periplasmic component/surface adhesin n=1 Tax=Vibrio maritimus TaxID=990268 RepID=A0A090RQG7_9VIBR|nr:ABC-type metal ion transport system periplasmic component/surface adhesin [Vibrio maritimus]